ncbi:related to Mannosyl-oligosaccharide alpha-1,2-mannosidase [Phialocephala subalpina]|uniref:alpha-1,2-Mannosidase n=1 Tax=Phialocephala subalpina TaxID=576137 RepID=A0A1L7WS67_9HELO|nr:related to Mannosyl-oligosaccharide alpha-1,2-mannosidase [Phialocephala subalpina]
MRFSEHFFLAVFAGTVAAQGNSCKTIQYAFPAETNGNATRAEAVKAAYIRSWSEYAANCFGNDDLLPVSRGCRNDLDGFGATIIDGMDTAIIMGLTNIVARQLEHAATVDFSKASALVELFDINIRYIGGMLSAHDLLASGLFPNPYNQNHVDALVTQAAKLATNLKPCFETATGLPATYVNYTTMQPVAGFPLTVGHTTYLNVTNTAQAGTLILEWYRLSDKTGDRSFHDLAEKAESWLLKPNPPPRYPGLVGTATDSNTGRFLTLDGGWKSGVDSFLEYLVKTHIYNPAEDINDQWKNFWFTAADSTQDFIALHPYGHPELTFLSELDNDGNIEWSMDDYSCFAGGNLMLGGKYFDRPDLIALGEAAAESCHVTYNTTVTGLGPLSKSFPETIESIFYGWRITGDPKWQEYNWEIFQALNTTRTENAPYWEITDVNAEYGGQPYDYLSSYYFAETLKYLYLTFAEPDVVSLDRFTFNTECHPMLIQAGTCAVEEAKRKELF